VSRARRVAVGVERFVALLVAASMVGLAGPAVARAGPSEQFEVLLERGSELVERGDHARAGSVLAQAYRLLPREERIGELGRYVVSEGSGAFLAAAAVADDPTAVLETCASFLEEYFQELEEARAQGRPSVVADDEEASLRERLDSIRQRLAGPDDPPTPSSHDAPRHETRVSERREDRPASRNPMAIAFLSAGAVALGAGVGMTALGARYPRLVDARLADARRQYMVGDDARLPENWVTHRDRELVRGRALLGSGVALAVVGVALVTWGAIYLARHRRGKGAVARR
jgi:hypothetical protein